MKKPVNKKVAQILVVACVCVFAVGGYIVGAQSAAPGTPSDPLVTRSYVHARMNQMAQIVLDSEDITVNADLTFTPINLNTGQVVVGDYGTEVILRRGTATAVTFTDGIVDMTAGAELFDGANIPSNHLITLPSDDGRGIRITSNDSWVMVRGSYTIQ